MHPGAMSIIHVTAAKEMFTLPGELLQKVLRRSYSATQAYSVNHLWCIVYYSEIKLQQQWHNLQHHINYH